MHFTIREIDHVVIRCADLDNMVRFYGAALGCPVEKEQRDLGLVQLRAGRSLIDLLAVGAKIDRPDSGAPGAGRNMDHLCLRVEPFDPAALRRASHGKRRTHRRGSQSIRRRRLRSFALPVRSGRQYDRTEGTARRLSVHFPRWLQHRPVERHRVDRCAAERRLAVLHRQLQPHRAFGQCA